MLPLNRELSQRLAQRLWVHPGNEDFSQCFFNARRALFHLTRLRLVETVQYSEGFAVYFDHEAELHQVALHGWVTANGQAIDTDYANYGRYDAVYFPGLHLSIEQLHYWLQNSSPRGDGGAIGFDWDGAAMDRAYVAAWDYVIVRWPQEITPRDLEHLNRWRK